MTRSLLRLLVISLLLVAAVVAAGCGSDDTGPATFPNSPDSGGLPGDGLDASFNGKDGGPLQSIQIQPQDPVVDVTIADGVVTTTPLTFTATGNNGASIAASFGLDRGELGDLIASTGVFTASGNLGGTGTVTATYQGLEAQTSLTVHIVMTQNGPPDGGVVDGGAGGYGGVGGSGPGNAVDSQTKQRLMGPSQKPQSAQELGFLYPYDKTVWPRGVLAPLLQWQTTHTIAYVRIHLEQKNFSFDGFYGGSALVNQPIDPNAWKKALYGNGGDALHADLYVADQNTVWGPISEDWPVAAGTLKGTVYYNSYNSGLNANGATTGAVLAIKPGATAPTLAIPSLKGKCHVCHEVASDGSSLYTQISSSLVDNSQYYAPNASFDMTNNAQQIASYTGNAPDGTNNDRKFLWSAVYPDGTFALSNSRHAREHNTLDSDLFARADGTRIDSTGLNGVVSSAVTPAFSPDGKRVAFNFWEGAGGGGVTAGAGHSLAVMDFDCGQGNGVTCSGAPPYAFGNLKELYRDNTRWPAWPSFTPDGAALLFHNTVTKGTCGDCEIATWYGAQAELWYTDVPKNGSPMPVRMNALDGLDASNQRYLPQNGDHPDDTVLNYEPTVNPIASGGYYWVVFTSRRMYGNVAAGKPYDNGDGTYPIAKKLWVAAVDMNPKPGDDPSHPAFYLPGQELDAGNMRGFWVVDPCQPNGTDCETGDECCNGFCRKAEDGGGLVCTDKPPGCAQEFEKCTTDADCCGANSGIACIGGRCSKKSPN